MTTELTAPQVRQYLKKVEAVEPGDYEADQSRRDGEHHLKQVRWGKPIPREPLGGHWEAVPHPEVRAQGLLAARSQGSAL